MVANILKFPFYTLDELCGSILRNYSTSQVGHLKYLFWNHLIDKFWTRKKYQSIQNQSSVGVKNFNRKRKKDVLVINIFYNSHVLLCNKLYCITF